MVEPCAEGAEMEGSTCNLFVGGFGGMVGGGRRGGGGWGERQAKSGERSEPGKGLDQWQMLR